MSILRRDAIKQFGMGMASMTAAQAASGATLHQRTPIKIGQIGVGHAHASKLSAYRQSSEYEVVGIVEPDSELKQRSMTQGPFRDLPWMTQEQLLNVPGLQAVLVETRVRDLLDVAESCVSAGKHIHLDKPAGASLPQFKRILDSAKEQKLLIQMGYMYRYNPAVVLMKDFLKRGWLGEIFEVHTVMSKVVGDEDRKELAEFHGGIMFELGCHILDLTIGVLGEPQQVTSYHRHSSKSADKLSDNMMIVLSYPKAIASVKSSAVEVDGGSRRHFVACGTEGTFHIQPLDNPSAKIALASPRGTYKRGTQDVTFPKYVRYLDDAADMARIIRQEKESDFSYHHDWIVQKTLLQACEMPIS